MNTSLFFTIVTRIVSTLSTSLVGLGYGVALFGDFWGFWIGLMIGGFFGAWVAFDGMPKMIKDEFYIGVVSMAIFMSMTYPKNSEVVHSQAVTIKAKEILLTWDADIATIKKGKVKNTPLLSDEKLKNDLLLIKSKITSQLSSINLEDIKLEVLNTYNSKKKHGRKHNDWWKSQQALSGCKEIKSLDNSEVINHRIACIAEYRRDLLADKSLVIEKNTIISKIALVEDKNIIIKQDNNTTNLDFYNAQKRISKARKDATAKAMSEDEIKNILLIFGFLIEGVIVAFDLLLAWRQKRRLKAEQELDLLQGEVIKKELIENDLHIELSKSIARISLEEKNSFIRKINLMTVWDKKYVAKRRMAIYNNYLSAWLIALEKDLDSFLEITPFDIVTYNKKSEWLGSTATSLKEVNGVSPQRKVLIFLKKNNVNPKMVTKQRYLKLLSVFMSLHKA